MKCVWEHNGNDSLLYSVDFIGAYTRGKSLEIAVSKMQSEIESYSLWSGQICHEDSEVEIVQEKNSNLNIADADSDVIFNSEKLPLSREEYDKLKVLALKSASDFHSLFAAIPDKERSSASERKTFYGDVPRTALQMYEHTRSVNAYYFGEIGINADNVGTVFECRSRGFELLERTENFLENAVFDGSYSELWSLRKLFRRFLWHDRIHAKAMYRMAVKTFGAESVPNIFKFLLLY